MPLVNNPTEGQIVEISPGRKMIFTGGRWKLHLNSIGLSVSPGTVIQPPVVGSTPPENTTNPFLFDPNSPALFFQNIVDGESQWIEV